MSSNESDEKRKIQVFEMEVKVKMRVAGLHLCYGTQYTPHRSNRTSVG